MLVYRRVFLYFHPEDWEDEPILTVAYFSNGWVKNHQVEFVFELPSGRFGVENFRRDLVDGDSLF